MRSTLFSLFVAALAGLSVPAAADNNPTRLVELFTSQGCSSCPPADALIGELAGRPDVLAVSLHVDYWDHLGWRDPFAFAEAVQRQREYAHRLGLRGLYTPQFVVQGVADVAGSDRAALVGAIAAAPPAAVAMSVRPDGANRMVLEISGTPPAGGADVWLMRFSEQEQTAVGRGENSSRRLIEFNVVRSLRKVGEWRAPDEKLSVNLSDNAAKAANWAVILQARSGGLVLGVVRGG